MGVTAKCMERDLARETHWEGLFILGAGDFKTKESI
jgi:hypothetical protein